MSNFVDGCQIVKRQIQPTLFYKLTHKMRENLNLTIFNTIKNDLHKKSLCSVGHSRGLVIFQDKYIIITVSSESPGVKKRSGNYIQLKIKLLFFGQFNEMIPKVIS
jgi:hypothetical protein